MKNALIKTDDPDYLKDQNTGALISSNVKEFNKFKQKHLQSQKLKIQENDLNNIKSEVSEIKDEISEIKDLLRQLLK